MQFIIDHMAAVVVASLVFLALLAINHRNQEATVDSVNYGALNEQALSFVDILKRDMRGVSYVETIVSEAGTGHSEFRFRAQIDTTDTTKVPITYRITKVGKRDTLDLYQLQRFERYGGVDKPAGASMVSLTDWKIEARNKSGEKAINLSDVRRIYVRFRAVAPYRDDKTIGQTGWEATFQPPLLEPMNKTI